MSNLSPAAQAVLTAYNQRELVTKRTTALVAALRAAADQVVPANGSRKNNEIRAEFLAIAAELEAQ
jgi:hypothetical protein